MYTLQTSVRSGYIDYVKNFSYCAASGMYEYKLVPGEWLDSQISEKANWKVTLAELSLGSVWNSSVQGITKKFMYWTTL